MRRLTLHTSALNDAEYDLYTSSLDDLAESTTDDPKKPADDAYYEHLNVGVREARAWLRGRYSHISVSEIDSILKLFYPNLDQSDSLTGGQFFAALRLVVHAEGGEGVDRSLAFVQAHPKPIPKSSSPERSYNPPPPPPVASRPRSTDRNPFARKSSDAQLPSTRENLSAGTFTQSSPKKVNHNPFLHRDKDRYGSGDGKSIPPLPPRKPVPPPRHASLLLNNSGASSSKQPPVIPPPLPATSSSSIHTTHITSPLIRQSLQASKAAQTMKKAEEQLEKERVMQVLKKASNTPMPKSDGRTSPLKNSGSEGSSPGPGEKAPPLPARRASKSCPSSVASSQRSLEQVASASVLSAPRSPFDHSESATDLPPPTHPDRSRKPSASGSDMVLPPTPLSPQSPQQPRVFRSKSMHHASPSPPVPPRRKRPESVQLTPIASPDVSPFGTPPQQHSSPPLPSHTPTLSRHLSLTSHSRRLGEDQHAPLAPDSPISIANIQRTLNSLQLKAQPTLDKARYKAEAGLLPKRGYVHHTNKSPWAEEGEEGLMVGDGGASVDVDYTDSDDDERMGRDLGNSRAWKVERDEMKWPRGEGWNPL